MTDMKGRKVPETFEQRRNQSNQKMLLGPPPISPGVNLGESGGL